VNGEEQKKEEDFAPPKTLKQLFDVEQVAELCGHTETVEFCKFDKTGKWLVTGGMNNHLRVWDVANGFELKQTLD